MLQCILVFSIVMTVFYNVISLFSSVITVRKKPCITAAGTQAIVASSVSRNIGIESTSACVDASVTDCAHRYHILRNMSYILLHKYLYGYVIGSPEETLFHCNGAI